MMKNEQKIKTLLEQILTGNLNETQESQAFEQISQLSPDPYWSDLVFWSNEFNLVGGEFDYDKFLQKIAQYPTSEHGKLRAKIYQLLSDLLNRNFVTENEMTIVNQLTTLLGNNHWIDDVFVKNTYKNSDNSFNYDEFLMQNLPIAHEIQQSF